MLTTDINTALALKANQVDFKTTSNSVTNNIALISALQTQSGGIGTWAISSSYYAFFHPSVIQTGGDRYSLLQHSTGNTYLNGVDNTDIMVNDIGKIRMTTTTTTMDNSNTYIRTGGWDRIIVTGSTTKFDGINGVDIYANDSLKIAVGT